MVDRDDQGRPVLITTGVKGAQKFRYNIDGDMVAVTDASGATTRLSYDAAGRVVRLIDARGTYRRPIIHRFRYDANDRLTKYVDPAGAVTTASFDAAGRLTSITDALGRVTRYTLTTQDQVAALKAADGTTTTYTYDAALRRLSRTDGRGHTTRYEYDAADQMVALVAPGDRRWTMTYTELGSLATLTDANGNVTAEVGDGTTNWSYDKSARPVRIDYSDDTPDVDLSYDAYGNMVSVKDGLGTSKLSYNRAGRLTSAERPDGTFRYSYDSDGYLSATTYPSGLVIRYSYDANGRLAKLTTPQGTARYTYDRAGNLVRRDLPGRVIQRMTHDAAGRTVQIRTTRNGGRLELREYVYDRVGNLTKRKLNGRAETFTYDKMDRLTSSCQRTRSGTSIQGAQYGWDAAGNRTSVKSGRTQTTVSYDEFDLPVGRGAPTFDRNGNQLTVDGYQADYDQANRLISLAKGAKNTTGSNGAKNPRRAQKISYSYDAFGQRSREMSSSADGQKAETTRILARDLNSALSNVAEIRSTGGKWKSLTSLVYAADDLEFVDVDGRKASVLRDQLGSTVGLIEFSGRRKISAFAYDPFGVPEGATHGRGFVIGFTGQYADPFSQTIDMRARVYEPKTGRFLQRDPWPRSELLPAISAYIYADGRPTTLTDPSGECPWCVLAAAGAVVGGAVGAGTYAVTTPANERSTQGWLGAVGGGAVSGAVGAVAGSVAGTAVRAAFGASSTGAAAVGVATGINGTAGLLGTAVDHGISGEPWSWREAGVNIVGGATGAYLGSRLISSPGTNTLAQAGHFAPRTWNGLINLSQINTRRVWGQAFVGGAVSFGSSLFDDWAMGVNGK